MRIYLSCLQSPHRHPVAAYQFWEPYFKRGIEEAGHEWVETPGVDWAEPLVYDDEGAFAAWRERTWPVVIEDIARQHRARPISMFLGYFYPRQIAEGAIREIQALGIPCVNFFCDNVREFSRVPREYRPFDLHWIPEHDALPLYRRAGLRGVHRPMPVWVPPAQRTHEHEERHPATFIGTRDSMREALFAEVIRAGGTVDLRGPGWLPGTAPKAAAAQPTNVSIGRRISNQGLMVKRFGAASLIWRATYQLRRRVPDAVFAAHARASVFGDEYVGVTQQASVTIGVNRYPTYRRPFFRPGTYSRLRDIEAPMVGACYLAEWTPELEHMYDVGREIEVYRTAGEMVEKIRMLEREPVRRRTLRREGQRRALADHSVAVTIQTLLREVGAA